MNDPDQMLVPEAENRSARAGHEAWVLCGLVALGAAGRWAVDVPNFAPTAAITLFSGFYFRDLRRAVLVPLAAMLLSDLWIGFYSPQVMLVVYTAFLFPLCFRRMLRSRVTLPRIGGAVVSGSIVFFLTTNFAHWAWMGSYPLTLGGLSACYGAALPFFKFTLLGDVFWCGITFGTYGLIHAYSRRGAGFRIPRQNAGQTGCGTGPMAGRSLHRSTRSNKLSMDMPG